MSIQATSSTTIIRTQLVEVPCTSCNGPDATDKTEETGFDAALQDKAEADKKDKAKQASGLTGTGTNLLDNLPPLALPTPDSVAADRQKVGDALSQTLAIAGIKSDPPIAFRLDGSGGVAVDGDDPRAELVNGVLAREPALRQQLNKLVSDAQLIEQASASEGYIQQVQAGADPAAAGQRLVAAGQAIANTTGFTLGSDGKLSLEVTGLGRKLVPPEPTQVSDDEKLFREIIRLTDRTRRTGVTAAAEDATQQEKDDSDTRQDTGSGQGNPSANTKINTAKAA